MSDFIQVDRIDYDAQGNRSKLTPILLNLDSVKYFSPSPDDTVTFCHGTDDMVFSLNENLIDLSNRIRDDRKL